MPQPSCPYCGDQHKGICPRVSSIECEVNGSPLISSPLIKRVWFHPPLDRDALTDTVGQMRAELEVLRDEIMAMRAETGGTLKPDRNTDGAAPYDADAWVRWVCNLFGSTTVLRLVEKICNKENVK